MTTIKFNIDYKTEWGEEICICGSLPQLGSLNQTDALVLSTKNGFNWNGVIQLHSIEKDPIQYYYFVSKNGIEDRKEDTPDRLLLITENAEYVVKDYWKEKSIQPYLNTSTFTNCVFKHSEFELSVCQKK